MYFMGIDGGGSNIRVVITDEQLNIIAQAHSGAVNASHVGRDAAMARIQDTMREAMDSIEQPILSVGIGIAGSSKAVAEEWLREIVLGVLPDTHCVPSSDNEIALVGAAGKREGLLLLAGTGSVGFASNKNGDTVQVGGWGYILDDKGSGYWLGLQALRLVSIAIDEQQTKSEFVQKFMDDNAFYTPRDLINWVYHTDKFPVPRIAKFAPHVLEAAAQGDDLAVSILEDATAYMIGLADTLKRHLNMQDPEIVFAGSLLTNDNVYRDMLMQQLGLQTPPVAKYPPMIGAALLAKLEYDKQVATS